MIRIAKKLQVSSLLLLAIAIGLSTSSCSGVKAELNRGKAALDARNYEEARKILQPLADAGNPRASMWLGQLYRDGDSVPQNYYLARRLFKKARR